MPLIIPKELPAYGELSRENVFVMHQQRAQTQQIRPLRILILNLMPTKIVTETQLARLLANSPLQVQLTFLQTKTHDTTHTPQEHMKAFYKTFDAVRNERFDGMIITGAPIEISAGNFGQTNFNGYASGGVSDHISLSLGFSRKAQEKDYRIGKKNLPPLSETEELILDKKSYGDIMTNTQFQINQFMGKLNAAFNDLWSADLSGIFVTSNDIEMPGNYWHSEGLTKKDFDRINTSVDLHRNTSDNRLLISPYYSLYNESNYDNNKIGRAHV